MFAVAARLLAKVGNLDVIFARDVIQLNQSGGGQHLQKFQHPGFADLVELERIEGGPKKGGMGFATAEIIDRRHETAEEYFLGIVQLIDARRGKYAFAEDSIWHDWRGKG